MSCLTTVTESASSERPSERNVDGPPWELATIAAGVTVESICPARLSSRSAFQGSTGANALVIEPADGKIIAVGSSDTSGQESVALARYLP
ncbi:MAG: hypothetical protein JO286_09885, partial [Solirubrobacterales bacterium]|nr:hypothetical protein [Solirubrobacterales bacterium]